MISACSIINANYGSYMSKEQIISALKKTVADYGSSFSAYKKCTFS